MRATLRLSAELRDLRKRLGSRDAAVREQACLDAQCLPAETLLRLADNEARLVRRRTQIQNVVGTSGCVWFLLLLVTLCFQLGFQRVFLPWNCLLVVGLPVFIIWSIRLEAAKQTCYSLSRVINTQTDARFVAAALLFYHEIDSRYQQSLYKEVRQMLLCVLPHVMVADKATWTPAQKAALRYHVDFPWHDMEMTYCELQTLERVGDAEDARVVRKLATMSLNKVYLEIHQNVHAENRKPLYQAILASETASPVKEGQIDGEARMVMHDARYRQWCRDQAMVLHETAERCLAKIMERAVQHRNADVLLRAADTTGRNSAQILLRPSDTVVSATPPEQLLRPGEK